MKNAPPPKGVKTRVPEQRCPLGNYDNSRRRCGELRGSAPAILALVSQYRIDVAHGAVSYIRRRGERERDTIAFSNYLRKCEVYLAYLQYSMRSVHVHPNQRRDEVITDFGTSYM